MTNMKSLLKAITLFTLGLTLVSCSKEESDSATGQEPSLTKVVIITDWYPQPEHGGFYQAKAKGFYEQAGLKLKFARVAVFAISGPWWHSTK